MILANLMEKNTSMINLLWNTSKKMIAGRSFPTKTSTEPHATEETQKRALPALFKQPHPFREGNGKVACAAPRALITGACASQAWIVGEKCVKDRLWNPFQVKLQSLSSITLHRSVMCRSCGFAAAVEYCKYSTSTFNFVQCVVLRSLKMKVLYAYKNRIWSSLRQE